MWTLRWSCRTLWDISTFSSKAVIESLLHTHFCQILNTSYLLCMPVIFLIGSAALEASRIVQCMNVSSFKPSLHAAEVRKCAHETQCRRCHIYTRGLRDLYMTWRSKTLRVRARSTNTSDQRIWEKKLIRDNTLKYVALLALHVSGSHSWFWRTSALQILDVSFFENTWLYQLISWVCQINETTNMFSVGVLKDPKWKPLLYIEPK